MPDAAMGAPIAVIRRSMGRFGGEALTCTPVDMWWVVDGVW